MVSTSRGILKYSIDRARAKELGGTITESASTETNDRSSNFLGSIMALFTLVKILNSFDTRRSYPYDDNPYEITPSRTCFSLKGWIIPWFTACSRIQRSLLIDKKTPRRSRDSGSALFKLVQNLHLTRRLTR